MFYGILKATNSKVCVFFYFRELIEEKGMVGYVYFTLRKSGKNVHAKKGFCNQVSESQEKPGPIILFVLNMEMKLKEKEVRTICTGSKSVNNRM